MIEAVSLSKSYNQGKLNEVNALKHVNLIFENTGLVFIVGKSGSGKSTLLNLLGGMESPSSGKIVIDGQELTSANADVFRREKLSFVFQKKNLIPHLTVYQNFEIAGLRLDKADKVLRMIGLEGYGKRKCNELSGGEEQRISIARVFLKNAPIVLCDEPTGALDQANAKVVFEWLKELSKHSLVIVASHDEESAIAYANRIVRLEDGTVVNDHLISHSSGEQVSSYRGYRLSFKNRLGLLFASLKKKKIRISLASILLGAALAASVLAISHAFEKEDESYLHAASSADYVSFSYGRNRSELRAIGDAQAVFAYEEFHSIRDKYPDAIDIYGLNKKLDSPRAALQYSEYLPRDSIENLSDMEKVLSSGADSVVEINENTKTSFPLVAGRYPTNESEVAIPDFACDLFLKHGYRMNSDASPVFFGNASGFVQGEPEFRLYSDLANVKVVGVVNTGFSPNDYPANAASAYSEGPIFQNVGRNRLQEDLLFSPKFSIVAHHSLISRLFYEQDSYKIHQGATRSEIELVHKDGSAKRSFGRFYRAQGNVIEFSGIDTEGVYLPVDDLASLYGDIVFPSGLFEPLNYRECGHYFCDFSSLGSDLNFLNASYVFATQIGERSSNLTSLACGEYVRKNGLDVIEDLPAFKAYAQSSYDAAFRAGEIDRLVDFDVESEENSNYLKSFYANYLSSFNGTMKRGFYSNLFSKISGKDIVADFVRNVLSLTLVEAKKKATIQSNEMLRFYGTNIRTLDILGMFMPNDFSNSNQLAFSPNVFSDIVKELGYLSNLITLSIPHRLTIAELRELDAFCQKKSLSLENSSLAAYRSFGTSFWSNLTGLLSFIGGICSLFSVLLLCLIEANSIKNREQELYLRRAFGLSRTGLCMALVSEGIVLSFFGLIISLPVGLMVSWGVNYYFSSLAGATMNIIVLSPIAFIIAFIISSAVASLICLAFALKHDTFRLASALKEE